MADETDEKKSINEFMATPEWVDEQKKLGLLDNQSPRQVTVRGTLVYVIDRVALDEAVKAKATKPSKESARG